MVKLGERGTERWGLKLNEVKREIGVETPRYGVALGFIKAPLL